MPKLVSEIPQGKSFERNGENGLVADSAVRQWRILLNTPHESFDITAAPPNGVGVKIGDKLDNVNPIPCVSLSVTADGSSRMTRLVTARYASTPGEDTAAGDDPGTQDPSARLSIVSVSTSTVEMPSWTWYLVLPDGSVIGDRQEAANPVGDMYDGVIKAEPVSIITVEQFDFPTDPTVHCQHIGKVNSNAAVWRGLSIPKRCLLFRGLSFRPQVVSYGALVLRGWQSSYEFALRMNEQRVVDVSGSMTTSYCGWDMAVPQTGFNCFVGNAIKRATVQLPGSTEEVPSAQPVPLNDDGTQRARTANPKVLVKRRGYHEQADFSQIFSHLRLAEGS